MSCSDSWCLKIVRGLGVSGDFCSSFQSLAAENWKERRPNEKLDLGVTNEIYLLGCVLRVGAAMVTSELRSLFSVKPRLIDDLEPVGLATNMKRGPANKSMGSSIWGFGDKMDCTGIDCIQFVE